MTTKYLILASLVSGVLGISENVTVNGLGNIFGLRETTQWSNRTIYSFRGIPYAQPPVGDLRFRPPVKITTWNGELNATKFGNVCPQSATTATIIGLSGSDEDCLTLNVYVPEVDDQREALPVMIFIHGGSFRGGFAQLYEPHQLLEEDVILVVLQFRLGPLGLLCLHTDEVPGNVQFLDQIMAMQWVQDNIQYFGGDANKVTLFGQSSGAASANLHQFSPLSKGLFHQVILQSGSAFAGWAIDYDPVQTAKDIGELVGCNETDVDSLAACFKSLDVSTILDSIYSYYMIYEDKGDTGSWANKAVIQKAGTQRFLEEDPSTLLDRGDYTRVPMIGGATKHEGTQILAVMYFNHLNPLGLEDDEEYVKYDLMSYMANYFGEVDKTGSLSQTFMNTYFQENDVGNFSKMFPGLVDICGVLTIKAGVYRMLQSNSRKNPSYLYRFGYFGTKSTWYISATWPFENGVPHGDDLPYLFPIFDDLSDEDVIVAKRLVKLWTSFAATGKPVADGKTWEPLTTPFGPYLIIDEELFDGSNYLSEHTIATREGLTPVDRSQTSTIVP